MIEIAIDPYTKVHTRNVLICSAYYHYDTATLEIDIMSVYL